MIRFDILSLFPEMFESPFNFSILKRARENNLLDVHLHNIRDYAEDKHRVTDDAPYGGGGGMVMKVEPIDRALAAIADEQNRGLIVLLTPQGEPFTQEIARDLSSCPRIILICGHYEGVDERVRNSLVDREISIGDYILTGGELSAMVVVDAVSRLIPGILGNNESAFMDSFSDGLLEYPHYTRPANYRGMQVPDVLLSGNHRNIQMWRRKESLKKTYLRRSDLLNKIKMSEEDKKILEEIVRQLRDEEEILK
jgi:tRNA (guanine37-N1)-methyltransferase